MKFDRTKMIEALRGVVQCMHYPLEVMLVCVRWYVTFETENKWTPHFWQLSNHQTEQLAQRLAVLALADDVGVVVRAALHEYESLGRRRTLV